MAKGRRMGKCNNKECGGDLISHYPYNDGWLHCSKCKQTINMKHIQDEQKKEKNNGC